MEKIITAVFKVESEGYQAITELKAAPAADSFFVSQAVLVKKENGRITVLDSFDTGYETKDDAIRGGLVGAMIGILGGPLGMLLGGSIGALAGSTIDLDDSVNNATILERMTELFVDGETALITLGKETEEGAVQKYLSKYEVSVVEEDAAEVEAEVRHAAEVQKKLEKQARKELRAEKREKIKENLAGKKEKLEQKKEKKKAEKKAKKESKKEPKDEAGKKAKKKAKKKSGKKAEKEAEA